ncbi:MAG TPA: hypothetical protein VF193_13410 [Steroidobacter sp.]
MKTTLAAFALLCFASSAVLAHDKECSLGTLRGNYVFSASGHSLIGDVWIPKAIVETLHFNGDGTLSVIAATVANAGGSGAVTQSPPGGTGTYVLDTNCRGTLQFTPGPSFDIFVARRGGGLWMIQTNPGNVFQGYVKKVP